MIYLYMFLTSIVLSFGMSRFFYKKNLQVGTISLNNVKHYFFAILTFLPFFLISAFRYNVGTDYIVYSKLQIPSVLNGYPNNVEPLYKFLIILGNFFGTYQLIFALTHLIFLIFICLSVSRESDSYFWSIVVFMGSGMFNYSLNIMRQSIAMAIIVFAFYYIEKNKTKYYFYVIMAVMFHKMTIIFLFIPLLRRVKIKITIFVTLFLSILLFKETIRLILIFITKKFGFYSHYFGGILDRGEIGWTFLVINLSILIIFYYISYRYHIESKLSDWYILFQVITVLIVAISDILPNYERIMYMFLYFQIISVPFFIKKIPNKGIKIIISIMLMIIYTILFYKLFVLSNIGETFPYFSIINNN